MPFPTNPIKLKATTEAIDEIARSLFAHSDTLPPIRVFSLALAA